MEKKKIALLGLDGADRKKLMDKYCPENKDFIRTIGIDFARKIINGTHFLICDTIYLSQGRTQPVLLSQLRCTDGVVYAFDVNNRKSFEKIDQDFAKLKEIIPDAKIVLVGINFSERETTNDEEKGMKFSSIFNYIASLTGFGKKEEECVEAKEDFVGSEEGKAAAAKLGCEFFEISEFTKEQVDSAFQILIDQIV